MSFSIIAAVGKNGEIGIGDKLVWRMSEDLKRFKEITANHTVIMGRKTLESIGHALPNRENIVITRNPNYRCPNCIIVHSLEEALLISKDNQETFIMGGGEIFEQALPFVEKMYLTVVDDKSEIADAYFPEIKLSDWQVTKASAGHNKESEPNFSFVIYERKKNQQI